MDDATPTEYLQLAARVGHRSRGLGERLRGGADPAALLAGAAAELAQLPAATAQALRAGDARADAQQLAERLATCGARLLPISAAGFPPALRDIPDPPPWLFVRGATTALSRPLVAMVGSRRASAAGMQLAEELAARLVEGGYGVCSGLALGIDAAAHRGALRGAGTTVAVLGTGIDECYPRRHAALADAVIDSGCLASELPPGTPPHRGQFPRRNRIVSGLALATVIVEAALPSGSLHTASAALEQGREVFVLPWSLLHPGGAGCLYLLRDGATPLTSLEELEEHFPLLARAREPCDDDEALLSLIGDGAVDLDALAAASAIPAPGLLARLGALETQGRVRRCGGRYQRA
jgi:DNA processing protein